MGLTKEGSERSLGWLWVCESQAFTKLRVEGLRAASAQVGTAPGELFLKEWTLCMALGGTTSLCTKSIAKQLGSQRLW